MLDIRTAVRYSVERMYAAGHGINQMRATRAGGYLPRWGRVVAVLGAVCMVAVGFAVAAHGSSPKADATVVVQPGDTLWSIAAEHYPADDIRVRVDDIERANGLRGPIIEVGQTLHLPG
jgi:nucleoid-associated protein YgaU